MRSLPRRVRGIPMGLVLVGIVIWSFYSAMTGFPATADSLVVSGLLFGGDMEASSVKGLCVILFK